MVDIQTEIASRVKDMREVCEISVQDMASKLDVPVETYTKYETGEIDIPASILYEAAAIFNVDTSLLLTGEDTRMSVFAVTRKDKGIRIDRREAYDYENLASNFTHKAIEPFIVTVMPRDDNYIPEPNYHKGYEFVYVLEGNLRIYIKDNIIDLNPGDSIYFDSLHKHSMVAIGDKKVKFLDVLNNKGGID
ncbi:helix-turn-helix domain-containing protein [Methanosphaera sp. WGK6]|uniref:helix-turn-helix domain-containing protein n=1 Tax=Methanosphaera sp. WGK6 TaxID=1561964 RepID=UPI00084BF450|nr:cupin domain-containing protein [Methanosphaera sp. WGK6]OED30258.1 transcriptional regulator [Methanosphaera sp. WGK6]